MIRVIPSLISVDGPDGMGKSSFCPVLAEAISAMTSHDTIVVAPTRFETSEAGLEIQRQLKAELPTVGTLEHNRFYNRTMSVNYETVVVPALDAGWVCVLDSSEIRALAFMIDTGSGEAVADTKRAILSGELTASVFPGNRIVLTAAADDLMANLKCRGKPDSGDPRCTEEVKRRLDAYAQSLDFVRSIPVDGESTWIAEVLFHVHPNQMRSFHEHLAESLVARLRIGAAR